MRQNDEAFDAIKNAYKKRILQKQKEKEQKTKDNVKRDKLYDYLKKRNSGAAC